MTDNAVTTTGESFLTIPEDELGKEFENVDHGISQQETSTPWLKVLQSLSPAVKKGTPDHIDGAEEGDLL